MESYGTDQEAIWAEGGMGLNRTKHATIRCRQRCIKEEDLDLIIRYGSRVTRPGGVVEYFISKKDRKNIIRDFKYRGNPRYHIQKLDKLVGMAIIVNEDDAVIITVYHRN